MMPSSVASTDLAEAAPSNSTAFGFSSANARSTKGAQTACSAGVGVRLPGGRQNTVLVMNTRPSSPASASIRSRKPLRSLVAASSPASAASWGDPSSQGIGNH